MHDGWVCLHRKMLDSRVFQNEGLLKIWCWCLLKASHEEQWSTIVTGRGDTEVKILPGQFIFGRNTAAKELRMKPSTVRNRIKKLKSIGNIDIQQDKHYSVITVMNWDIYQLQDHKEDRQKDNQRTTKGQPKDTYNNDNNNNNKILTRFSVKEIFDFWNNQRIIQHRKFDPRTKSAIKKALEIYSKEEIESAIVNYNKTISDPSSWWQAKNTLKDFLNRHLERFCPANFNPSDYADNSGRKQQEKPAPKPRGSKYAN